MHEFWWITNEGCILHHLCRQGAQGAMGRELQGELYKHSHNSILKAFEITNFMASTLRRPCEPLYEIYFLQKTISSCLLRSVPKTRSALVDTSSNTACTQNTSGRRHCSLDQGPTQAIANLRSRSCHLQLANRMIADPHQICSYLRRQ